MLARTKFQPPDAFATTIHEQEAREPAVGLVGEDRELDQLLLEVATVPRPADTASRFDQEVARLSAQDAALEAARELLAGLLRDDRNGPGLVPDLSMKTLERLETARDAFKAQRRARGSRR